MPTVIVDIIYHEFKPQQIQNVRKVTINQVTERLILNHKDSTPTQRNDLRIIREIQITED